LVFSSLAKVTDKKTVCSKPIFKEILIKVYCRSTRLLYFPLQIIGGELSFRSTNKFKESG
jgi:hypothetical protein